MEKEGRKKEGKKGEIRHKEAGREGRTQGTEG